MIATATGAVSSQFADGTGVVAITPDGKHAYVTNGDVDGTMFVIKTATGKVSSRISVGAGARRGDHS